MEQHLVAIESSLRIVAELADHLAVVAADLQRGSAVAAGPVPDGDSVPAHGARASADASLEGPHVVGPQAVEVSDGVLVVAWTAVVTGDSGAAAGDPASSEAAKQGAANGEGGSADQRSDSLPSQAGSLAVERQLVLHQLLGHVLVCRTDTGKGRPRVSDSESLAFRCQNLAIQRTTAYKQVKLIGEKKLENCVRCHSLSWSCNLTLHRVKKKEKRKKRKKKRKKCVVGGGG